MTAEAPSAYAADVSLARACAQGVEDALASFERAYAADLAGAIASVERSPAFVEEALQALRERLFVGAAGRPGKIAEYGGRASLRTWLRTVAVRTAISLKRRKGERGHTSFASEHDRRLVEKGPEAEYLARRYKHAFEEAVRCALAELPSRERTILRLHLVEGMSVDRLAAVYKVGRSTTARWLAAARQALLDRTKQDLHARFRLTSTELDSLALAVRSQLEVSVLEALARASSAG
jgi:RNA polymerase sigma-70 factor (ECF subfamily)